MSPDRLIYMANQIGKYFASQKHSDPARKNAEDKYKQLKAEYSEVYYAAKDEILQRLSEESESGGSNADIKEARENVALLKAEKEGLEQSLEKVSIENSQEASDQVRIYMMRGEIASTKELLDAVNKRLETLRMEQKDSTRISQVTSARPAGLPTADNRMKFMVLGPVGALVVVLALFVMIELKIGRVSDLDDLSKCIPVEVFALPPLPGGCRRAHGW